MAVSGVTGGGTSIYGSRNVLSGLASGMDTESMIENMTKATRAKIAQQKQKKTMLGWKQQAYQGISTQLIEFSQKYMDYQSPTNLLSPSFFDQTIVTSVGKNSGLVSATGKTKSEVEINGVKQLATSATHTVDEKNSIILQNSELKSKDIGMDEDVTIHELAGESLTFQYGNKKYRIRLTQGADLSSVDKIADEINKQLAETEVAGGQKLSDKLDVTVKDDGTGKKSLVFNNIDKTGNKLAITGASENIENKLNLDFGASEEGIKLQQNSKFETETIDEKALTREEPMSEFLVDKRMTFSLNGKSQSITLLTSAEKAEMDGKKTAQEKNEFFKEKLQKKLDDAFGEKKFQVAFDSVSGTNKGKLKFTAVNTSDVIRVEGGSGELFGKEGAFGIDVGDGNRLNMNRSLEKLGIKFVNGQDKQPLVINGITVGTYNKDTKLADIIKDINSNSELGVTATYSELTNELTLSTKDTGVKTKIDIKAGSLGEQIFGKTNNVKGQDAIVDVTIDGKRQTLNRDSNTININGLDVTVSDEFGDYKNGSLNLDPKETVTFTSKPDTEKVFDAIKEMVEDYNKIVDSVYKELTTKPSREYEPLTDEQKKEMTKEEIEKWEEKAKEGQLFMDTQLRSLKDQLGTIFSPADKELNMIMKSIGIEPTKDHRDGGKIRLDEAKLKEALSSNPETVKNAFNAPATANNGHGSGYQGGVFTQLKGVTNQFASTSLSTPGSLVALAGSPKSANSMLNNNIQKDMDAIDKVLDGLDRKLKKEIDRYNSRFTQLEKLIAQMNAQSGQLAGLMGGGM